MPIRTNCVTQTKSGAVIAVKHADSRRNNGPEDADIEGYRTARLMH
ncbi:MAG: hypothetical protein O3A93_11530 [Chloroflexi bacterium]|nr:hypothetical protein [Chloroflexota bacterium]MDA1271870.1 hypothetical protein [Chloroflexota bacterium]